MYSMSTLSDTVRLEASQLNSMYRECLLRSLRERYEGCCSRFGYIKNDSIEIVKVSAGTVRQSSLNGDVVFVVQFRANVFNPSVGSRVQARVHGENRFGILAAVHDADEEGQGHDDIDNCVIMNIIVTKQSTIESNAAALSVITYGSRVEVELVGKRYSLKDPCMSAVGRIVAAEDTSLVKGGAEEYGSEFVLANDEDDKTTAPAAVADTDDDGSVGDEDENENSDEDEDNEGDREIEVEDVEAEEDDAVAEEEDGGSGDVEEDDAGDFDGGLAVNEDDIDEDADADDEDEDFGE